MPRLVPASSDMPQNAARAQRAIAATTRTEVLRYLLSHPNSTTIEVINGTHLSRETVRTTLSELEETYVVCSAPPGQRRGRLVTYTVDRPTLAQDLGALSAYLLG